MTYCTLAQVKAFYPNATLLAVQITKGRDYAWNGAVDGVVVNDTVYDLAPVSAPITSTGHGSTSGTPGTSGTTRSEGRARRARAAAGVRCVSTRSVTLRRPKNARRSTATYVDRNGRRRTVSLSRKGTRISFSGRSVTKGAVTVVHVRDTVGRKTKSRDGAAHALLVGQRDRQLLQGVHLLLHAVHPGVEDRVADTDDQDQVVPLQCLGQRTG